MAEGAQGTLKLGQARGEVNRCISRYTDGVSGEGSILVDTFPRDQHNPFLLPQFARFPTVIRLALHPHRVDFQEREV